MTKNFLARAAMTLLVALLGFTAGTSVTQASTTRTTVIAQTVPLSEGWNWFSSNVEINLDDLKAALVQALPDASITVQAYDNRYTAYNPSNKRWTGRLNTIDISQMYMIQVGAACELVLEAEPIDPEVHSIDIGSGDNWIGFPFSENMSVASAFAGFAVAGDIVYSHTAFAYYDGNIWRGTLSALEPGQGYIYHSEAVENIFTYPTEYESGSNGSSITPHWAVDYHTFKRHYPVVAALKIDGQIIGDTNRFEVAAFNAEDVCIGSGFAMDGATAGTYLLFGIPVYADGSSGEVHFKLYDHEEEQECTIDCNIFYEGNIMTIASGEVHLEGLKNLDDPIILSFSPLSTVYASAYPDDGGTISGTGVYEYGSTCTLTATANEGYRFYNWTAGGTVTSNESELSLTIDNYDVEFVAHFAKDITTFPWTEDFNGLSMSCQLPHCWDNSDGTIDRDDSRWCYREGESHPGACTNASYDGTNCVAFNSWSPDQGEYNILKTPVMQLPQSTPMQLSFWYKNPTGGDFSVYLSTDGGTTYTTALATGLTNQPTWTEKVINLSNYAGNSNVVIVFKGTSNKGGFWDDPFIYLDDVTVEPYSTFPKPTGLEFKNVTYFTATLSWQENGEATAWQICLNDDETHLIDVAQSQGNSKIQTYELTGLTPSTTYTAKVRACAQTDHSNWSKTVTFTTLSAWLPPTHLAATDITSHSVVLGWMENSLVTVTEWVVAYKTAAAEAFTEVTVADNPYTLTGLDDNTTYTVKVRSVNDQNIIKWSDEITFTTLEANPVPVALTVSDITFTRATVSWTGYGDSYNVRYHKANSISSVVFTEGFENGIDGWTLNNCGLQTAITDEQNHSGNNAFMFDRYMANSAVQTQYLISPELTGVTDGMKMEFYYGSKYPNDNEVTFQVGFSTASSNLSDFTFGDIITTSDAQWHLYSEAIPADTKYVCWKVISTQLWSFYIDDIIIFTEDEYASLTPTQPTVTITGLTPQTTYEYQVQSVLGQLVSDWTPLATFTTAEPPFTGNLTASVTPTTATISWTGSADSYNVRCQEPSVVVLKEDFEGVTSAWTRRNCNNNSNFYENETYSHGGRTSFRFCYFISGTPTPQYLISPELTGVADGMKLEFYYRTLEKSETFQVGYSSTDNSTAAFTFGDAITLGGWNNYRLYSQPIPAGTKYICLKCTSNNNNLFIDDVFIGIGSPDGWATVSTTETSATFTGLKPLTVYEYQIQSVIDNEELEWTPLATFTTLEANPVPTDVAVNMLTPSTATISWMGYGDSYQVRYRPKGQTTVVYLTEEFENGNSWTRRDCNYNSNVYENQTYSHGGAKSFRFCYHNDGKTTPQYLISPELPEQTSTLQFYYRSMDWNMEKFRVGFSSTTSTTDAFTFGDEYSTADYTWHLFSQDIPAGTKYICLMYTSNKYNLLIDDICVTREWATAATTETAFTLTGLTPDTDYEYQVQSITGANSSSWTPLATFATPLELILDNDGTANAEAIAANNGVTCSVTLADRTLYKDGEWNTICLPFNVTLEGSPLEGAIAKTLTGATMTGTHVTLTFGNPDSETEPVTTLKAGVPYIIKWEADTEQPTITNPTFKDVELDSYIEPITMADGHVQFIGYYDAFTIDTPANDDIYYMTTGSLLKHTAKARTLKACRAYFQFSEAAAARQFILDFGSEASAIECIDGSRFHADALYDLGGRRIESRKAADGQLRKGMYIRNGHKVVIK